MNWIGLAFTVMIWAVALTLVGICLFAVFGCVWTAIQIIKE